MSLKDSESEFRATSAVLNCASYDFSKPYSESGEKTVSDEPKISISKILSWDGLHPS